MDVAVDTESFGPAPAVDDERGEEGNPTSPSWPRSERELALAASFRS